MKGEKEDEGECSYRRGSRRSGGEKVEAGRGELAISPLKGKSKRDEIEMGRGVGGGNRVGVDK